MKITAKTTDDGVEIKLRAMRARLSDMSPLFQDVAALLESRISARFETKTDPDGNPWAQWAEKTAEFHRRINRGSLLRVDDKLFASLSSDYSATSATVGFTPDYANYLEFGTVRMPARHMLLSEDGQNLGATDLASITNLVNDYFDVSGKGAP